MARTVDPVRHAARRQQILDAAFTCFARDGYGGTTTVAICRAAGIGSGTFFHYYPTKVSVLLAILAAGTEETRDWFVDQQGREDPCNVVLDWVRHTASAAADPRMPGFVRAVGALSGEPDVAAALAADDHAQRSGLGPWVTLAQQRATVRPDLSPTALTSWVMLLLDGYLARLASDERFTADDQRDVLVDVVDRLLALPHLPPGRQPDRDLL